MGRARDPRVESLDHRLKARAVVAAPELTERVAGGKVRCLACGHRCLILSGLDGICRVRFNRDGELMAPRGYVAGLQVDPVEKKPFFHVMPGSSALSFGMLGCDYHCGYCQNWLTSQVLRDDSAVSAPRDVEADDLVSLAVRHAAPVMVSTYNEPLITTEWAVEVFRKARKAGIVCGYVSNGNGTPEVLGYLRPHADLFKIDLKSFREKSYRELGGVLANVLDTIVAAHGAGFWVEIVTLLVPGFNDSEEELRELTAFIASVSPGIPWHVTAFHRDYKMIGPADTTVHDLTRAARIGREAGLDFVYAGNIPGGVGELEDTRCSSCGTTLVERMGFRVSKNDLDHRGVCPSCRASVPGVWAKSENDI